MAIAAFGAATAASYAMSGLVGVGLFVAGGLLGGFAGTALGRIMASSWHRASGWLGTVFACLVIIVGVYVVSRGLVGLTA